MAEEVKVFGFWASPFSWRVELALKLKGVPFEFIQEDLDNKSPLLLKYNPVHKKVPVLLHNGKPIAESIVIIEYIDETWKGFPLLPQDPYERAMARFWAKFIDEKCIPALWNVGWSKGEEHEKAKEVATELLKTLENALEGKKFFGGDTIGLVDIVANFIGYWLKIIQEALEFDFLTKERFPNLCAWMDNYIGCNIVKENVPPREKVRAFFKAKTKPPIYWW